MSPEEFERIKAAEKEHLRSLKKLKDAVRALRRQQSVADAMEQMTEAGRDAIDTQEEMIDRLALETARREARLEIAMEGAEEREAAARLAASEEELERLRAQELVRQMKGQMEGAAGTPPEAEKKPSSSPGTPTSAQSDAAEKAKSLPEKTIGRMRT